MSALRSSSASSHSAASTKVTRSRSSRFSVAGGAVGRGYHTVACHSGSGGSARSARRKTRRAARSSVAIITISGTSAAGALRGDVGAGRDHRVLAREVVLEQVAGGRVAGDAGVHAGEQQPRQRAGELGGEHALGGGVEAADVERARVAQGGARCAGGERLVDVDDVQRAAPSAPPRSSGPRPPAATPRAGGPVRRAAPRPPRAPSAHRRRSSSSCSGCERSTRRLSRTSDADSEGATIRTRWPRAASSSDTRATYSLTSLAASHANGVTCAMARRWGAGTDHMLLSAAQPARHPPGLNPAAASGTVPGCPVPRRD